MYSADTYVSARPNDRDTYVYLCNFDFLYLYEYESPNNPQNGETWIPAVFFENKSLMMF